MNIDDIDHSKLLLESTKKYANEPKRNSKYNPNNIVQERIAYNVSGNELLLLTPICKASLESVKFLHNDHSHMTYLKVAPEFGEKITNLCHYLAQNCKEEIVNPIRKSKTESEIEYLTINFSKKNVIPVYDHNNKLLSFYNTNDLSQLPKDIQIEVICNLTRSIMKSGVYFSFYGIQIRLADQCLFS